MKQILKAALVLSIAVGTLAGSTMAYFTSVANATGNQITTGTLRLVLYSTGAGTGDSFRVGYDNGTSFTYEQNFPIIANMQPGEERDQYVAVGNFGTLPFKYRANVTGTWGNGALDVQNMIAATEVRRFGTGCSNAQCLDLRSYLPGQSMTHVGPGATDWAGTPAITGDFGYGLGASNGDNNFVLNPGESQIFRVRVALDSAAGNDFQGQTFTYALNMTARQLNDPAW